MKTKNQPMKTYNRNLFTRLGVALRKAWVLPAVIAGLSLIPTGRVTAQVFTTLHSFNRSSDGIQPSAGLILSGSTLYGTAERGGSWGNGTVFAVNTNGTGFANLHSFSASSDAAGIYATNDDGINPAARLVFSGDTLYGTAAYGGGSGHGALFAVNSNGSGFTNLHSFSGDSDGGRPYGGLIISGSTLYGTTSQGGSCCYGTIFAVNTNGTDFRNLHSFRAGSPDSSGAYTNSDGVSPFAGLILSGSTLYGTTVQGGSSGLGTVFAVNTNGAGFTTVHSFTAWYTNSSGAYTNSDGAEPFGGLILSGNTLYGTASSGGSSGGGTVFAVNTNGTGFTTLHSFTAISDSDNYTNSDGASPYASLLLSDNTLYGMAGGGSAGLGTVFAVTTNGSGFATLYNFPSGSDGPQYPVGELVLFANTLYGMRTSDGWFGPPGIRSTVFSLSFQPQLSITHSGSYAILSWPAKVAGFDYSGFTLQSTTNLISPAVWTTNSPAPVVVNGQNTVTNPISGPRKFYRLSQ
jgi:uncharacterized repeat protein (TIGR03803 family)